MFTLVFFELIKEISIRYKNEIKTGKDRSFVYWILIGPIKNFLKNNMTYLLENYRKTWEKN